MIVRQVLFRGKKLSDGEWVQGHYFETLTKDIHHYITKPDFTAVLGYVNYGVDIKSVCEYTGLVDINGVLIFEGDIIKHYNRIDSEYPNSFDVGVVYWNENDLGWRRTGRTTSQYIKTHGYWISENSKYEVIGNIYDNPELIEVMK